MSLLIEDMGMLKYKPEDSLFTQYPTCICVYPDGSAKLSILIQQDDGIYKRDPNDYQVRGISTPHGRLIDADRLIKALEKQWNVDDDQDFANKTVWREIESAPTVIEKEMNQ